MDSKAQLETGAAKNIQTARKIIGILAGMGPRSTTPFLEMVIDQCQMQYGAKNDIDFPHMLIYSLPTPFYVDRPINHKDMEETVIRGICKLEDAGADYIVIPCNSVHIYFDAFREAARVPLLNVIDETVKELPQGKCRVTLLGTSGTYQSGLYQKGILDDGHEFVFHDEWQDIVNEMIKTIKAYKNDPHAVALWQKLLAEIKGEKIDAIIIACTDLNVVTDKCKSRIKLVDSSASLAKATIKKYLELL